MATIEDSKYKEKETCEKLAKSDNPFERLLVAESKTAVAAITRETLIKLANDREAHVRIAISENKIAEAILGSGRKREIFDAGFSTRSLKRESNGTKGRSTSTLETGCGREYF
ncbi:MAG: hypothetical protein ABR981_00945 [Candidatus Micrarchaeaceae archaeon]|jgi:uncharacterized protein with ATP-grasp and redox domains